MTGAERAELREELAALDAERMHFLLRLLAGSDPAAVRYALGVERAVERVTRPGGAEVR